jgi:type II secretory pathway pseudopilin PulG
LSFTLIELLFLLGILLVLASVLLVSSGGPLPATLRAKAATEANQIQVACMAYYNDYGGYPVPTNAPTGVELYYGTHDTNDWKNLMWALCGNINAYNATTVTSTVPNTRSIAYLQLSKNNIDDNGIPLNPIAPEMPSYFNIILDGTGSGPLTNLPSFMTNSGGGVFVWADCNANGSSNVNFWVHAP